MSTGEIALRSGFQSFARAAGTKIAQAISRKILKDRSK
jgi:hypothetical protein